MSTMNNDNNNSLIPSTIISTTTTTTTTNTLNNDEAEDNDFRDIHALTPPQPPPLPLPPSRQRAWDSTSLRSSNMSMASDATNSSENFTTMSREFNALVLAGSGLDRTDPTPDPYPGENEGRNENRGGNGNNFNNNLDRIGEEVEDTNPLAIVPDSNPLPSPRNGSALGFLMGSSYNNSSRGGNNNNNNDDNNNNNNSGTEVAVHRVKKEEVETKITAWQTAKVAKINNRFKREDAIISGWENEQVHKASSWMKKVERKLEEKRAKAMEKMQNDMAKAHRKAEERRASAEAKRGTKVAKVLEITNLMRAVGRPPAKRSFF